MGVFVSVRQSLLAILGQGPCYGYQLRAEFDRRSGSNWPLNVGQIYNTLDRLERDGLVSKADTDREGHVYYRITDAGRAQVDSWLGAPVVRSAAARDELALKLAVAATLPGVDVAQVIASQRAVSTGILSDLSDTRDAVAEPQSADEIAALLVLDSALEHARAEVRWLDAAAVLVSDARHAGVAAPLPLNTEAPKRGRPLKASA
jgi:DNA-binding PadR family transcriptional regulator